MSASPSTVQVIEARGLTRSFGDDRAVDRADLAVAAGQIHALVGLNGAGKTTLMKLLLDMLRPSSGSGWLLGDPVDGAGAAVWSRVGHLIETPFGYRN